MALPPRVLRGSLLGLELGNEGSRRIIFSGKKRELRALNWQRRQRQDMLPTTSAIIPPGPIKRARRAINAYGHGANKQAAGLPPRVALVI